MDPFRGGQHADASGSRGAVSTLSAVQTVTDSQAAYGNQPRKGKKKVKASSSSTGAAPRPYLATAPTPITGLSQEEIEAMASRSMVLPSNFIRQAAAKPQTSQSSQTRSNGSTTPAPRKKKSYATELLAPPTIMPGGQSARPRPQTSQSTNTVPRRSTDRLDRAERIERPAILTVPTASEQRRRGLENRTRSTERLREIGGHNASMMSLGHLGQIFESDPMEPSPPPVPTAVQQAAPARRRRRVVGEEAGRTRRPTVSSVEEGRALGLARGASMRRRNVWDGECRLDLVQVKLNDTDLPETADPPPAFPFPVSSTSRQPPSFSGSGSQNALDTPTLSQTASSTGQNGAEDHRSRSPPPTFEQAIGLAPLGPVTATTGSASASTSTSTAQPQPRSQPSTSSSPAVQPSAENETISPPAPIPTPAVEVSRASTPETDYASAPSSPVMSEASYGDHTEEEREDRRLWNADLLAGYSLEQRVQREIARKIARERNTAFHSPRVQLDREGIAVETQEIQTVRRESTENTPAVPSSQTVPLPAQSASELLAQEGAPVPSTSSTKAETDTAVLQVEAPTETSNHSDTAHGVFEAQSETARAPTEAVAIQKSPPADTRAEASTETLQDPTAIPDVAAPPSIEAPASHVKDIEQLESVSPVSDVKTPFILAIAEETPKTPTIVEAPAVTAQQTSTGSTEEAHEVAPEQTKVLASPPNTKAANPLEAPPKDSVPERNEEEDTMEVLQTPKEAQEPTPLPPHTPSSRSEPLEPEDPIESIASTPSSVSPEPAYSTKYSTPFKTSPGPNPNGVSSKTSTPGVSRQTSLRRSTSSPALSPVKASFAAVPQGPPPKPLFSRPAFAQTAKVDQTTQPAAPAGSEPSREVFGPTGGSLVTDGKNIQMPRLRRMASQPDVKARPDAEQASSLPPHREAALKRRDLALKRVEPVVPPIEDVAPPPIAKSPVLTKKALVKPDPPISRLKAPSEAVVATPRRVSLKPPVFPRSTEASPGTAELRDLAASTAQLLQFLETSPSAAQTSEQTLSKTLDQPVTPPMPRRKPPPPPGLKSVITSDGLTRKPSVLSTADSPLMPSPILSPSSRTNAKGKGKAPPAPTRRPPPPPPITSSSPCNEATPPSLPPRPSAPPSFDSGSAPASRDMSRSPSLDSSVSERTSVVIMPEWRIRPPRLAPPSRPRGPRPPPVPPRPWAKAVARRPTVDRTQSERPLDRDFEGELLEVPPAHTRSASLQDLRDPGPVLEYTDADLYVSRLEGTGREYEGLSHLTDFFGPAKDPGATEGALETLLPGLIQVDSRRKNAAGKVKLKLSLLGVRVSKCPICLNQFRDRDKAVMLPECGHHAHDVCARRWFKEDHKCFVCREPLRDGELVL